MIRNFSLGALALIAAGSAPMAVAQTSQHGGSTSLQGDTKAWSDNAHMRAFYDLTKERLPVWKHQVFTDGTDEWVNCA